MACAYGALRLMLMTMKTLYIAKALLVDETGDCLVLQRSKTHPTMALKPDLPGGVIEENESPIEAICRETKEETGFAISPNDTHLLFASADVFDHKNFIRFVFVARLAGSRPQAALSWEHDGHQWMPLREVEDYLEHPVYKRAVAYITQNNLVV